MALRAGDRVRVTCNDPASGPVGTVDAIGKGGVRFRLEDGTALHLSARLN